MQNIFVATMSPQGVSTHQDVQEWRGTQQQFHCQLLWGTGNFKSIVPRGQKEGHPAAMLQLPCSPCNTLAWKIPCKRVGCRGRCQLQVLHLLPL